MEEDTKKSAETINNAGTHVMVVDDEDFLVNMWRISLEKRGYTVTAFMRSTDALKSFKENPDAYDIVVTDQTMPEMPGNCLAVELLKIRRNLPVVICTGYSDVIDEDRAKRLGISEFLMKPFDIHQLDSTIHKLVIRKNLQEGEG